MLVSPFATETPTEPYRPTVSATQVDTFDKCERAWYFGSVLGHRPPASKRQALGTKIHDALEKVVKGQDQVFDDPQVADAVDAVIKHVMPSLASGPLANWVAEGGFEMPTYPGGPNWKGFIDLQTLGGPSIMQPMVVDYKTTSDRRYAKTPAELAQNVQMMSYAKHVLDKAPGASSVVLAHVYILTKGRPKAWIVSTVVSREDVESVWERDLVKVRAMEEIRLAAPDPQDVRPNGVENGHCQAYGGCPHRERCGLSAESSLVSAFGPRKPQGVVQMSDFLARIAALKAKATTTPPPAGDPVPEGTPAIAAVTPPPAAPIPNPLMAALEAKRKADADLEALTRAPAPVGYAERRAAGETGHGMYEGPPPAAATPAPNVMVTGPAAQVIAPDLPAGAGVIVPAQVAAEARARAANVVPPDAPPREFTPADPATTADPAATQALLRTEAETPQDPAAKRRGRPPKTKPPEDVAALQEALADVREIIREKDQEIDRLEKALEALCKIETPAAGRETHLYVNCTPTKGPDRWEAILFEDWIAPIAAEAAKIGKVSHWSFMEFGKGRGLLACAIQAWLAPDGGNNPPPRVLVIDTGTPGADVALEILTPYAKEITRGTR